MAKSRTRWVKQTVHSREWVGSSPLVCTANNIVGILGVCAVRVYRVQTIGMFGVECLDPVIFPF